jgi:hypothetical protein
MKRLRVSQRRFASAALAGLVLLGAQPARAQEGPPVQGTIVLEGTMKRFYRAANVVIVATIDGVEHMYHFTRDLVVHGGRGAGVDALEGLREGSTVVIHYVDEAEPSLREVDVIGDHGLAITEGLVAHIDRSHAQVTVRYDNGRTEVFRLTPRTATEMSQAAEQAEASGARVVIYYSDEHGRKVAHFFKRVSQ